MWFKSTACQFKLRICGRYYPHRIQKERQYPQQKQSIAEFAVDYLHIRSKRKNTEETQQKFQFKLKKIPTLLTFPGVPIAIP